MDLRTHPRSDDEPATAAAPPEAMCLEGRDALGWAKTVWDDRDTWLRHRGGVESVFVAAQVLGCREDAVAWLRGRTRL